MDEPSDAKPSERPSQEEVGEAELARRDRQEARAMLRSGMKYSFIGIEFGLALFVGWYGGSYLDDWLGTTPYMMVLGIGFGFSAALRDLYLLVKRAKREMEADTEDDGTVSTPPTVGGE